MALSRIRIQIARVIVRTTHIFGAYFAAPLPLSSLISLPCIWVVFFSFFADIGLPFITARGFVQCGANCHGL